MVAGLRQLYGSVSTLPESIRTEAADFVQQVFSSATVTSAHHLPISETQGVLWTRDQGSVTDRGGTKTLTAFPVRVLAQKELYERTKPDPDDPYLASRNLLLLVDEAIEAAGDGARATFTAEQTAAEYRCQNAVQARLQLESALSRRDEIVARRAELSRQIEVLDDPVARLGASTTHVLCASTLILGGSYFAERNDKQDAAAD